MTEIEQLPDDLDTFVNRIDQALADFCMEYGIDSLKDEPQNVFSAALMFVHRQVFKATTKQERNRNSILDYVRDIDILYGVCLHYVFICSVNDKAISVLDFSKLTGISNEMIRRWKLQGVGIVNDNCRIDEEVRAKQVAIYKLLVENREASLANKLLNANMRSYVGVLATLNKQFGWSLPGVSREEVNPRLSRSEMLQGVDSLPDKDDSSTPQIGIPVSNFANQDTFPDA